jgi:hypothetical protein
VPLTDSVDESSLRTWWIELPIQEVIDAEATEVIGAGPHERTERRTN